MKLVSTTVCGNSEKTILECVLSVRDMVDHVVLLDTGCADATIHLARSVCGDKLSVIPFTWINDFSAARNAALEAAAAVCADHYAGRNGMGYNALEMRTTWSENRSSAPWCVMVDTDETIDFGRFAGKSDELVEYLLSIRGKDHVMIDHQSRIYAQPRFYRLPVRGKFEGPTHEAYPAAALGSVKSQDIVFCDKPKGPEASRVKLERDLAILQKYTLENPRAPRWFYYLGDTLSNLGREAGAIDAFDECWKLNGWDEESAWAAYRMCICWANLGNWAKVVECGIKGMQRHAGMAELAWQTAFGYHKLGNHRQAIYWAHLAVVHGYYRGDGLTIDRVGFKFLHALFEKPYEVLHFAHAALGDTTLAVEYEVERLKAERARVAFTSGDSVPFINSVPATKTAEGPVIASLKSESDQPAHFYKSLPGYFTFPDFYSWLADQMPSDAPSRIIELGTHQGQSAAYLGIELLRRDKTQCRIDCIDFFREIGTNGLADNLKPIESVIGNIHAGDTSTFASIYKDKSVDAVFIDADHSADGVGKDIYAWLPKVKPGGIIAGHDFNNEFPGIIAAVIARFAEFKVMRGEKFSNGQYYPTWSLKVPA